MSSVPGSGVWANSKLRCTCTWYSYLYIYIPIPVQVPVYVHTSIYSIYIVQQYVDYTVYINRWIDFDCTVYYVVQVCSLSKRHIYSRAVHLIYTSYTTNADVHVVAASIY